MYLFIDGIDLSKMLVSFYIQIEELLRGNLSKITRISEYKQMMFYFHVNYSQ